MGGRAATTNLTPQNQKNLLISRMMARAHYLTDRSKHQVNGQNGLAYVSNGKQIDEPITPAGECTAEKLVGLDCSGFIYQLTQEARLMAIPKGRAESQGDTTLWNRAFKESVEYTKLQAERMENVTASDIIAGDLIYFITKGKVNHTAVALNDGSGALKFYQSSGTDAKSGNCDANKGLKRGPKEWNLTSANLSSFGDSYYIIRPTADISGSWTIRLRCTGQSTDAITTELNFKTKKDASFTALGSGIDYGGDPVDVSIKGFYNKKENKLQGDMTFSFPQNPGEERVDSFQVVLNEDETPYIITTKKVDNGGCVAEIKLINKEKNG
ncbi:MAG: hypothetical protein C0490_11720 [Marivirga sp.]|nr:hypothetical protein [Marivirga sp.]